MKNNLTLNSTIASVNDVNAMNGDVTMCRNHGRSQTLGLRGKGGGGWGTIGQDIVAV